MAYATLAVTRTCGSARGAWIVAGVWLLAVCVARPACSQLRGDLINVPISTVPGNRFELAESVSLDRADSTVRTYLKRVDAYLADGQWDEAVETLRQVMEESGDKLLGVTEARFVTVRDYCHLQLASLPPDALALYRGRVDPVARQWYDRGVEQRSAALLSRVVDEVFASSWGDNALAALGEMALESGDYTAARSYWEKIIPVDPPAGQPRTWLSVPDTDLDLAAVRARLVLTSILEGSGARAAEELAALARLHPDARGGLGSGKGKYAETLRTLLSESAGWPEVPAKSGWPTFAGSPAREKVSPAGLEPGAVAWRFKLPESLPANRSIWGSRTPIPRVAEDAERPLSYHPVLAGNLVLVNGQLEILALDVATGRPAWGNFGGQVYRDDLDEPVHLLYNPPDNVGVPRFTMTVAGGKLYARMGSGVTGRPRGQSPTGGNGYLVCVDLEAQGRLLWKTAPEDGSWAFEGSPVVEGANVYVAMRRSDIRPQAHVACLDAESGRLRWRQFVCAAETPARGMMHETTHNLLTLEGETLYYNTNLGAVAALSTRGGRLKWVSLYPRALQGDLLKPAAHLCRDLNPCLAYRGILLVAPVDSPRILALEAATGQILWHTSPVVQDAVHLLGVAGDNLIAAGERLYWIGLGEGNAGKVKRVWPDGHEKLGYGRGVLAADFVYWPTRQKIYLFDPPSGRMEKTIDLAARGAGGGNLLVTPQHLLIATGNELIALRRRSRPGPDPVKITSAFIGNP